MSRWNPALHPRDPAGRFTEAGITPGWARQISDRVGSSRAEQHMAAARHGGADWHREFVAAQRVRHEGLRLDLYPTSSGHLVLSRIQLPTKGTGAGTQIMNELTELADQHGVPLALTPSADFGGSVPRLTRFYRRHGFVPNKGRARDLTVSESMIRLPRRAAAR